MDLAWSRSVPKKEGTPSFAIMTFGPDDGMGDHRWVMIFAHFSGTGEHEDAAAAGGEARRRSVQPREGTGDGDHRHRPRRAVG